MCGKTLGIIDDENFVINLGKKFNEHCKNYINIDNIINEQCKINQINLYQNNNNKKNAVGKQIELYKDFFKKTYARFVYNIIASRNNGIDRTNFYQSLSEYLVPYIETKYFGVTSLLSISIKDTNKNKGDLFVMTGYKDKDKKIEGLSKTGIKRTKKANASFDKIFTVEIKSSSKDVDCSQLTPKTSDPDLYCYVDASYEFGKILIYYIDKNLILSHAPNKDGLTMKEKKNNSGLGSRNKISIVNVIAKNNLIPNIVYDVFHDNYVGELINPYISL